MTERAPQSEIPGDLRRDEEGGPTGVGTPGLDVRGALVSIRHTAHQSELTCARVVTAVDRILGALAKQAADRRLEERS